jgi:uncharacterized iron-regulated protein
MAHTSQCLDPATWYTFSNGGLKKTSESEVLERAAHRDVALLGEHHDDPDHHLWQLQVLAALHMLRPEMVIGFEAFPRRVQPVLDQWIAGQLTQSQFLERVEWQKIWNVPAALYLPLFEFARLNRIPMAALNVDRTLTSEISRKGWNAVPDEQREGVSRAAPALRAYEDSLFEAFSQHSKDDDKRALGRDDPAFRRFVEAQTTWDRAMAEAIASRLGAPGTSRALVVGIMGSGHVEHGHAVAHQLRDLGIRNTATLLPVKSSTPCAEIKPGVADAVFALPADPHDKPAAPDPAANEMR